MAEQRDRFTFMRSYLDAIEAMDPTDAKSFIKAIARYCMDDELPTQSGTTPTAFAVFMGVKYVADISKKKSESGKKGGSTRKRTEAESEIDEANASKRKQTEANASKRKQSEKIGKQVEEEVEVEIEVEEEVEKESTKNSLRNSVGNNPDQVLIGQVVDYLNEKTGSRYKASTDATKRHIRARINDGYSLDDFKTVIDNKCNQWLGSDMAKYLRPETLFGNKFESYLNETKTRNKPKAEELPDADDYFRLWG